jgi:hypothetical protein
MTGPYPTDEPPPVPAVDPWEGLTDPEPWTLPDQGAAAPPGSGPTPAGAQYSPGLASVPVPTPPASPGYPYVPVQPSEPPRGNGRIVAVVVGVLVVVLVAAGVVLIPKLLSARNNSATRSNSPSTGQTSPSQTTTPPSPDIFAGTPAVDFGKGADGIVLPTARPYNGFTKAEVSADLAMVKQAMTAARLDTTMLTGHDASKLVGLLAPDSRENVIKDFANNNAFAYATRLQPNTELTDDPVRVKGTFTIAAVTDSGLPALSIVTNFIWVYPIVAHRDGAGANLVVVRDRVTWILYASNRVQRSSEGLWLKHAQAFGSNMDCDLIDSDLVALAPVSISEAKTEAGSVYDLDADFAKVQFVC